MNKNYKVNTGHITLKKHPTVSTEFVEPLMTRSAEKGTASIAFTLVELLVVVAVIGILAGIVLAAAGGAQKKAARDQAKAEIRSIVVALERFRATNGFYPAPTPNPSSSALLGNLTNLVTFRTNQISGQQVLDPYGYPYWYRLVTNRSSANSTATTMADETVEVWSVGPNGRSGFTNATPNRTDANNADDLTSWN